MLDNCDMEKSLADKIVERLAALDKNPSAAAIEAGLGRSAIRDIIAGKARRPQADTISALSRVLECSISYLMGETDDPQNHSPNANPEFNFSIQKISGKLEAGVYREDEKSVEPIFSYEKSDAVYDDPRLPFKHFSLYVMGDNSLIDLNILEGDVLTYAWDFVDDEIVLKDGMLIICKYSPSIPGVYEKSARLVEIKDGVVNLKFENSETSGRTLTFPEPTVKSGGQFSQWDVNPQGRAYALGIVVRITRAMPVVM